MAVVRRPRRLAPPKPFRWSNLPSPQQRRPPASSLARTRRPWPAEGSVLHAAPPSPARHSHVSFPRSAPALPTRNKLPTSSVQMRILQRLMWPGCKRFPAEHSTTTLKSAGNCRRTPRRCHHRTQGRHPAATATEPHCTRERHATPRRTVSSLHQDASPTQSCAKR